jgi:transposase InsO family protein
VRDRIELVEKNHPCLSQRKQCDLLGVARSSVGYQAVAEDPEDIRVKRLLDEIYLKDPCLGSRRLVTVLERDHGVKINRKRLQRLRREIGHEAIWCKPRTSIPDSGHRKYPYLLRELAIERPDQAWCADITYVPMPGGHAYLCAVMDWHSRRVLGWALSNTMEAGMAEREQEGRQSFPTASWHGEVEETGFQNRCSLTGSPHMETLLIHTRLRFAKSDQMTHQYSLHSFQNIVRPLHAFLSLLRCHERLGAEEVRIHECGKSHSEIKRQPKGAGSDTPATLARISPNHATTPPPNPTATPLRPRANPRQTSPRRTSRSTRPLC